MNSQNGCSLLSNTNTVRLLVVAVIYLLCHALFAITRHPLSAFPGPRWAKITRIPYWIAAIRGEQIYFMQRLHTKYGPVVRFSPNELSYTDSQAWKDICGYEKGRSENLKAPEAHLPPQNGTPHLITTNAVDHTRVRRLFSPAFSDRALKEQEPLFQKYVDLLVRKLGETIGYPVDMTKMFEFTTFDIMGDLTFGQPLGLLESNKYSSWVKNVFDAVRVLPFIQMIEYYPWLSKTFALLEPKIITEMKTTHYRHSADRVDRRLEKDSDQPDIWNLVLSAEDGKGLTLAEMHSNSELFMLAGSETTATLLSGLCHLLLMNPNKLQRLKEEIRGQSNLTLETLAGLPFLNACIQEALRLYPPVPVGIARFIPAGGQVVCGRWLAPGTRVSIHQYATYRSATNFTDPDIFAPERWLPGEDADFKQDKRDALQPFSFGPRNCLGQNMAWHEMRLIFGTLVSRFDLELCEENAEAAGWMDQKVYGLWQKKPLMVCLTPFL